MKIGLINPPSPFLIDQKAFLPLGLLYLSSSLKKSGYDTEVIDLANKQDSIEETLKDIDCDMYGVTATTSQYDYAKEILSVLDKPVIIGGSHASSVPYKCLEDGFNGVIVGEGEKAIVSIANRIKDDTHFGILKFSYVDNIDTIPYPDREALNIREYKYSIDTGEATTLMTSRGCPHNCAFCSKDVWSGRVRFNSVEYVLGELDILINKYGYKNFLFLDDSILLKRSRAIDLLKHISKLGINFRCYSRADHLDREILKLMKEAGCIEVGIGVESGSQQILNNVNKGTKVEDNTRAVKLLREYGIQSNVFIMIGLPGETLETIEETKSWFKEAMPDKFGLNIFYPYIGTPIYKNRESYEINFNELCDKNSWLKGRKGEYNCFVSTNTLTSKELLDKHLELFEYFRKLTGWRKDWEGK